MMKTTRYKKSLSEMSFEERCSVCETANDTINKYDPELAAMNRDQKKIWAKKNKQKKSALAAILEMRGISK